MLRICLLGAPRFERDGSSLELPRRKLVALLAYLAVTAQRHGREPLAELLYPRQDRERARASFRNLLWQLRTSIGDALRTDRQSVWLSGDRSLTDVREFRRFASEGLRADRSGNTAKAARLFEEAARLAHGELLAGFGLSDSLPFEEWQRRESENLRREQAILLERLARNHGRQRRFADAAQWASRWLALDPLNEEAHRLLMRLYALAGNRAAGLQQFERCRRLLRQELDAEPDQETRELRDLIKRGAVPAPSSRPGDASQSFVRVSGSEARSSVQASTEHVILALGWGPASPGVRPSEGLPVEALAARIEKAGGRVPICLSDTCIAQFADLQSAAGAALGLLASDPLREESAGFCSESGLGAALHATPAESGTAYGRLPPSAALRSLGVHRLKDLGPARPILKLSHPDLPEVQLPLRTLDARPNNLSCQPTTFIGRRRELTAIIAALAEPEVRILTLTGAGGSGKTRLALQAAAMLVDGFEHGIFLVDLAPVRDPADVPAAIAEALGVKEAHAAGHPLETVLRDWLARRELLLVLDNLEHLIPAAPLVAELAGSCPRLKVLATSREALRLRAEHEFIVLPFDVPSPDRPPDEIRRSDAVRLFAQRVSAILPGFAVTDADAPLVAEICARLDGLPLAIELAAARTKVLSPRALLERLGHPLEALGFGPRDLPVRQRTLRNEIQWSYDLLQKEEQRLFRRLSVFAGGCTLESAQAVYAADDDGNPDSLDGLSALAEKSFLMKRECAGGPRFTMLETVREYAARRLEEHDDVEAVRHRFAVHFRDLAERAEPLLRGPDQATWLDRLDAETANIREALAWLAGQEPHDDGLRLAGAMGWYWFRRARFTEGHQWLERFHDSAGAKELPGPRAKVAFYLGLIALMGGRTGYSMRFYIYDCFRASLSLSWEADDVELVALSSVFLGSEMGERWVRGEQVWNTQADALVDTAVATARATGDPWTIAFCLRVAYWNRTIGGYRLASARASLDEALALARRTGDDFLLCYALLGRGAVDNVSGEHEACERRFEEALLIAREIDDQWLVPTSMNVLANLWTLLGRTEEAKELLRDALPMAMDTGARAVLASLFGGLDRAARREGRPIRAARLWGASMKQAVDGHPIDPALPEALDLEPEVGKREWSFGQSMTVEQAVVYAFSDE
jgi:predicted ATPase/DNA-binding SARP family transcriptional activator